MPRAPHRRPPSPDERQAALPLPAVRRTAPTPEQIVKAVTDKRPSPVGQPAKVELTVKLVLPRELAERLTARAIRSGHKFEALIQEILWEVAADGA
jgi:hypothetical protein